MLFLAHPASAIALDSDVVAFRFPWLSHHDTSLQQAKRTITIERCINARRWGRGDEQRFATVLGLVIGLHLLTLILIADAIRIGTDGKIDSVDNLVLHLDNKRFG